MLEASWTPELESMHAFIVHKKRNLSNYHPSQRTTLNRAGVALQVDFSVIKAE